MNLAFIIALIAFCAAVTACIVALLVRQRRAFGKKIQTFQLRRHSKNPIVSPLSFKEWGLNGTFNPAAFTDDNDNVHLLYRAIGTDGISRIGHASSHDGIHFDEHSHYPVYEPLSAYSLQNDPAIQGPHRYDPLIYISGGGWGGSEDPRTTRIDGRVYMTYTAFGGWDNMRIGLTSITVPDIEARRWRWRRQRLISSPKERSKNWVIFPEKIHGKYAILHSIAPRILIAYVDSLDMMPEIKSSADHHGYGVKERKRKGFWDEMTKGVGTPPLKTDKGWLILYHAVQPGRYLVGAMLLDLDDPTKILYRSPQPILEPEASYENDGKPGVVYATGAVIKDGNLIVYYGGGDKHVCIAQTPLAQLLDWLIKYGKV